MAGSRRAVPGADRQTQFPTAPGSFGDQLIQVVGLPPEDIERAHAKSLVLAAGGRCWPLKVIVDDPASAAGEVSIFESAHEGETIYEIGWMVLPEFQNRGIASQAVRAVLDKARAEQKFGRIHAFPAVTNGPSNKVCEKNGFLNQGECEFEFAGRTLRCNHWRIDLF